jgi:hypothetical protein
MADQGGLSGVRDKEADKGANRQIEHPDEQKSKNRSYGVIISAINDHFVLDSDQSD